MGRRVISLIRAQLNMNFSISYSRYYYLKKRQRPWEPILIALAILSVAVSVAAGVVKAVEFFYSSTEPMHQEALTLTLGILAAQGVVLVLGFVLVMAVFYFSNDLGILIPLPLRPAEVLTSKFAVILANEYLGLTVFVAPFLAAYGAFAGVRPVPYAITAFLIFLALPVVPLVIAAVPAILLMRVAGLSRRKDALVMAGGFVFLVVAVGFQLFVQMKAPGVGNEAEFLARVLSTANSLVDMVGSRFPPSIWATRALAEAGTARGLGNLALFLGVAILGFVLFLVIGHKAFYQGVVGGLEAGVRRAPARMAARRRAKSYSARPSVASLALTEMKLFVRTPVFALNGLAGFVVFPVMFGALLFAKSDPQFARIWEAFTSAPAIDALGALVIAAYFPAMAALSTIPFSAISREGRRNIWILRTLPVSGKAVALGKAVAAGAVIAFGSIPSIAVLEWAVRLPAVSVASGIALGIVASFTLCLGGVLFDMSRPMLYWIDQQKAVKSNLNTLLGMVVGLIALVACALGAMLGFRAGLSGWAVVAGVGALAILLLALMVRVLGSMANKLWKRLET